MNYLNSKEDALQALKELPAGEFPNLLLVHKPWEEKDYQVKYTDLYMGLENPRLKQGEPLVSLWVNVASIPCSEMTEEGITAIDEAGALELNIVEDTELGFPIRRWTVCRDTVGSVALT